MHNADMGITELASDEVLLLVDRLFDKSLVVGEEGGYRLLQTVREFSQELLSEGQDETQTRIQHFKYFCHFARECEERIRGPQQHDWHKKYLMAQDDLR